MDAPLPPEGLRDEAVQAVVFDWGGTLAAYVGVEMLDIWRLAGEHLDPTRSDEVTERLVAVEERFWARTATTSHAGTLADLLAEASAELGLDVAEAVLEEAALRHLDAWTPHIRHDPDAPAVLAALRNRGLRLGLLSNTHWPPAFHERFLDRDGLADLIDVRAYTSAMTHMKPHPDAFRHVLDALGVADPARVVFVGDRPFDDIHGAKAMGMRAVLRPNPLVEDYPVEPDARIARLGELLDLIDAWDQHAFLDGPGAP